ncbi:alpha/beta hydrolase family protein [Robertkochia solimangrovi]|uniref:alpha/beta hydrolase family protein n=1 Tax=Robertkochia solimangrovi TaxID=2213046 RepID=UPI00117F4F20|nr:acetylxylan esterase [Robertkochia solimangrovi]TRZ46178.1 alpha/beta hydrolase [Robertkochia solimangrovi]
MEIIRNHLLNAKEQRPVSADIYCDPSKENQPIVIFCHGYKGFKDWGYWDMAARQFAECGICFVKFDFSHNGFIPGSSEDFPDTEGFGLNNFSRELNDLAMVTDWVHSEEFPLRPNTDLSNINLIGHSRGGGITLIGASEDSRIRKVITWASVCDFKSRFADEKALAYWKANGVIHIENTRTRQQLPHFYQFYEDFIANEARFSIEAATKNLNIPVLVVHGDADPTVNITEAHKLEEWLKDGRLLTISGGDHVFGGIHPWEEKKLPDDFTKVAEASISFILEK